MVLWRTQSFCKESHFTILIFDKPKTQVIILDIMLPGKDGFEVCRRVRRRQSYIPIIMLTSRTDDVDKIVGLELGADDYVTKPFNARELIARIRSVLRLVSKAGASPDRDRLPMQFRSSAHQPRSRWLRRRWS